MANCTKCGAKIGMFAAQAADDSGLVKEYRAAGHDIPSGLCHACGTEIVGAIQKSEAEQARERQETETEARRVKVPQIPLTTLQSLDGKPHVTLGLTSSFVALGTGPLSQILSSVTDFLGKESNTYNEKMLEAEKACMDKLRLNASSMGATAVLGVQTTFTELTSGHGMLLVCMSGTAVRHSDAETEKA